MLKENFRISDTYKVTLAAIGQEELELKEGFAIPEIVSSILSVSKDHVYSLSQKHTDIAFEAPFEGEKRGDALYSFQKNSYLVIKTADCVPIFFWSKQKPCVGIAHSGWKGTKQNIIHKTLSLTGLDLESFEFYIGPCIRKDSYEVQLDVISEFQNYKNCYYQTDRGYMLGIDEIIKEQIFSFSKTAKILDSKVCTLKEKKFYSHRRKDLGRNLNIIYFE
ncbi:MAG: polyphenol oxidase family protein [Leptospiraceae bacterium]|nr:polyphenol oxidase family protein [Leptospiraceae bacterium]